MLGVVSMAVCMLCEWLGSILRLERHNAHDISAPVTGMIIPLMLPASSGTMWSSWPMYLPYCW